MVVRVYLLYDRILFAVKESLGDVVCDPNAVCFSGIIFFLSTVVEAAPGIC